MPQSVNLNSHVNDLRVVPLYPGDAKRVHFNMVPSTTIAKGTIVGKYSAGANALKTITDTGTVSGGTFTLTVTDPITNASVTTAAIAYNATGATVATALEAVLSDGATVTGSATTLPADTTLTFSGSLAGVPVGTITIDNTAITGGGSLLIANTTAGRSAGQVAAYVDSGLLDPAIGVMEYTVTSRADGRAVIGSTVRSPDNGEGMASVPVYLNGHFHADDLTGLDAAGLVNLGGRQVGDIVIIPGGN